MQNMVHFIIYQFHVTDHELLQCSNSVHLLSGSIVRINTYGLHINDPKYYDEVYAEGRKQCNKYDLFLRICGMNG
jgi:hypothetical protein